MPTSKNLPLTQRMELIQSLAEEITDIDELEDLLRSEENLSCYDGFEPSGKLHIAQGTLRAINTNKMIKAGFQFKFYVADWFAHLNKKLGGDMEKIRIAGQYFVEVWKASGMDLDNVEFIWASDLIKQDGYWETVMRIAGTTTLKRVLRTTQIMGRTDGDELHASQILYPCMQAADIHHLGVQVTQLGLDQRKVNMLAREIFPSLGLKKPIVVSSHMLMGLQKPPSKETTDTIERAIAMKMSKSNPDSAIFMTDQEDDIKRKINKAYCPPNQVEDNPILEYVKYIIFEAHHLIGHENILADGFVVERPDKFGGDIVYQSYDELEDAYAKGELFPLDLKNAVAKYLNVLISPVHKHFQENKQANEIMKQMDSFEITR